MNIKAILIDFDGTALQRDQVFISVRNMHALRTAMERGIMVIPCTGRSRDMFPPQIERDERFRYWVSSSGARILDRQTGEIIYQDSFTPEETAAICRVFEGHEVYCEIAAAGRIYLEKLVMDEIYRFPVPSHHTWWVETDRPIGLERPSEFFLSSGIGAEKFNFYGVPEEKQELFANQFRGMDFINFLDGALKDMQFVCRRLDKIGAVETLLRRLGIGYENVMAIGDSLAMDGPMIESAAIGVAMANAPKELRDKADYVTARFDEDGMALAIEKFCLN